MTETKKDKFWATTSKVLTYIVIFYIFYILGHSIWLNWALKKENDRIKADIAKVQDKNQNLENLITYYKSDSFKELEAREKLGMKKSDEKVVLVPVKKFDPTASQEDSLSLLSKKTVTQIANWRAWWSYIFQ